MRWMLRILAVVMLAVLPAAAQQAPAKFALVIGNAAYTVPAWKLENPVRDATLMATRLRSLGFQVDLLPNGSRAQMEQAFERFAMNLSRGGASAVSVFYYSGHGAEEGAVNYLIPVDADIRTKEQLRFRAPSAQLVLDEMGQAGNAVNIMILDACRDLPLADGGKALSHGGLAELRQTPNVFIAYATAPNQTAADGAGQNSPFTAALAEALRTQSGEPIELLFSDVNARVRSATGGVQQPRYSNGLPVPRWTFAASAAPRVAAPDPELERLRRENEALRRLGAGTPSSPQQTSPQKTSTTDAGGGARAPGSVFRDCADCPEMVVIPAGRFTMGDNSSDQTDERPAHTVSVSSFAAGKYEVTLGEWKAFVNATGRANPPNDCYTSSSQNGSWRAPGYTQDDRHPVACVNWSDAQAYALWLSQKTGQTYRLLTEAEWEYAARAGTTSAYWFGGSATPRNANYSESGNNGTVRVGAYGANAFGLHDTAGNVWEWTEDCYKDSYTGAPGDVSAVAMNSCSNRVFRGGSWGGDPSRLRSAIRSRVTPAVRNGYVGFRLARTVFTP